jgi:sRNA-binding carbon storage regulator CsrA
MAEHGNLVLTVRPGQPVAVGDDVLVTFLGADEHGRARVSIKAPKSVPVSRRDAAVPPHRRGGGRGR